MPKENKFTDYLVFRQALYKALFQYLIGAAAAGATELLPIAGFVNLVLPPGDTVPVVNNPDIEARVKLAATAAIIYIAGKILVIAAANPSIKY